MDDTQWANAVYDVAFALRSGAAFSPHGLLTRQQMMMAKAAAFGIDDTRTPKEDAPVARKKGMSLDQAEVLAGADRRQAITANPDLSEEGRRRAKSRGDAVVRRAQSLLTVREPDTYVRGNGRSYCRDLIVTQRNLPGASDAAKRLRNHAKDVESYPEFRDLDRVDGNGGHFVPPAYLVDKFVALVRAGRPYANIVQHQDLPPGVSSFEIPKISSGTRVEMQTADNAPVAEQDLDDTSIRADVKTAAGQQTVAIQLLDQSPINFDEVIFADLFTDYAMKVDRQTLAGSAAAGQVKGTRNTPGIQSITLTGTPTVAKFYTAIADATQRIHVGRLRAATDIVMHPRRWSWLTAAFDQNGRPLSVPEGQGPGNSVAALGQVTPEGVAGSMQGVRVVLDPNIGTTYGPGANEDVVYVQHSPDLWLWESTPHTRVLDAPGAENLSVLLQVYGYLAYTAERYPQSVVEISGLPTPVFG